MRTFIPAVLLTVAGLAEAGGAAAQTPPPASPPPPPPAAAPAPTPPPPAPPAAAPVAPGNPAPSPTPGAPPAAPAEGAGGTAPPAAAPATPTPPASPPAAPAPPWWSSLSGDAFVDAYGAINWNTPRPQFGSTGTHAFDQAQGFSLAQVGLDASFAADPIGGTISLRFGPQAALYNTAAVPGGSADNNYGLEYVRQAFATVKFGGSFTLDAGKFDQPFGSEVPDSQLNMEYTRSLLFALNQPLFFTGLRLDFAPVPMFDAKLIVANGWNNTIDDNTGKTIAAQVSVKPIDQLQLYIGYAGGPEQSDFYPITTIGPNGLSTSGVPAGATLGNQAGADSNWRHLVDFVADINPIPQLRFLLNADYDTEALPGNAHAVWYGANLAIRYLVADPFAITLRGEIFSDKHGTIVPNASDTTATPAKSTTMESGTLTLSYVIASHYSLMLDNRIDAADSAIFSTIHSTSKTQFTSTLGVIASTK